MELIVKLKDQATRQLNTISGKFKSTGAKVTALAKKFTMLAGVAGIAAVGLAAKNAISTFTDFEKAIANAASVTGATGEVFKETKAHIEAVSRELGETTVFSASQAANAFYDLASAGYDVANMTKGELKPIMDLAAATQTDLTKATEVVTSTLGQFGLGMKSSGRIADVFAKTIGSSKATVEALEYSLKYVGPVAKSMGMEIEEVNAILGNLYNAGFKGEQAGTALRGAFSRLLNPTKAMVTQLEAMGLTLEDVDPTTRDFADILDTLKDAGIDTAGAMKLFGVEAAPAMLALTDSTDDIRDLEAALSDAGGTAETMATQQLDTLSGSIALMKSAMEGVSITIGKVLAPYVRMLADWISAMIPVVMNLGAELKTKLTPLFNKLSGFIEDLIPKVKELIKHFANKLQPAFESIKNIVKTLGEIFGTLTSELGGNETAFVSLTSIANTIADVLNRVAGAVESVVNWFAEHPTITKFALAIAAAIILITTPLLAVIATLGVLAVAWDKDWLGIKTTTLEITAAISKEIEKFLKAVTKFWDDHGDAILKAVEFAWDAIKTVIDITLSAIQTSITVILALIKGDWEGAWNAIKDHVATVAEAITKLWDKWGDDIKTKVSDWAKDVVSLITTWASDVLGVITGWVTDTIDAFKGWVRDLIGGSILTDWASDTLKLFADWAKDALGEITGWGADSISAFSDWASDTLSDLGDWISDFIGDFADWSSDVLSGLSTWASDFISDFGTWASDVLTDLGDWISDYASDFTEWASDNITDLSTWASDFISDFETWASDVITELGNWASDMAERFLNWVDSIIGEGGILTGFFNDVFTLFQSLKNIKITWPEIPNPFAKVKGWYDEAMAYISAISGIGGDGEPEKPSGTIGAGTEFKALGGRLMTISKMEGGRVYYRSIDGGPSVSSWLTTGKFMDFVESIVSYLKGGEVESTGLAMLHEGEYVVPKSGGLVASGTSKTTIVNNYNFGNVYGVDELQKLLDRRDRELVRKLGALI